MGENECFFGHNIARGSGGTTGWTQSRTKKLSLGAGFYVTIAWKGFFTQSQVLLSSIVASLTVTPSDCILFHVTECHISLSITVRVKGGIRLRNGMWHELRNDIIMWNVIYEEWPKEHTLTQTRKVRREAERPKGDGEQFALLDFWITD